MQRDHVSGSHALVQCNGMCYRTAVALLSHCAVALSHCCRTAVGLVTPCIDGLRRVGCGCPLWCSIPLPCGPQRLSAPTSQTPQRIHLTQFNTVRAPSLALCDALFLHFLALLHPPPSLSVAIHWSTACLFMVVCVLPSATLGYPRLPSAGSFIRLRGCTAAPNWKQLWSTGCQLSHDGCLQPSSRRRFL